MDKLEHCKESIARAVTAREAEITALGEALFRTPELGFKEHKTRALLLDYLARQGLTPDREYAVTGFSVTLGHGKPHIALLAELDAIPTLGHPQADLGDQSAAHSCGHSTQCAIAVNALLALRDSGALDQGGTVTLFFTPAEEYTDLPYRESLQSQGKIRYRSGKLQMLADGVLDGVDVCLHLHAMGPSPYRFSVDSQLSGFVYKKFIFQGVAAHAAAGPHLGVNALNAFALFQCAAGMLRETFVDEDKNRFHGIVTEGGQTINSIPNQVVYESYVRSFDLLKLQSLSQRLTDAAVHCAKALGGDCQVEDVPGYLPFVQCHALSQVARGNMHRFASDAEIIDNERSPAAGDIGDVSVFYPAIQFGYGGFSGIIHGKTMAIEDPHRIYNEAAQVLAMTAADLLANPALVEEITGKFRPAMTPAAYFRYLDGTSPSPTAN